MRYIAWILRVLMFLVFFLFALKNYQEVPLKFYFDFELRAPLVLLLLVFFAAGMALGVLACLPRMFRQRRDLSAALAAAKKRPVPPVLPQTPPADGVALPESVAPGI
jgi:putative membrane protein